MLTPCCVHLGKEVQALLRDLLEIFHESNAPRLADDDGDAASGCLASTSAMSAGHSPQPDVAADLATEQENAAAPALATAHVHSLPK